MDYRATELSEFTVTQDSEIWRVIPDYDGHYEASSEGRIRSVTRRVPDGMGSTRLYRSKVLAQHQLVNGYLTTGLSKRGDNRPRLVHRLVASAFFGPPTDDQEVCHANGDRSDNRVENLRWGTHSENCLEQVAHGTHRNTSKDRCLRGHLFTDANTYIRPNGARNCVTCRNLKLRAWYRKRHPPITKTHRGPSSPT